MSVPVLILANLNPWKGSETLNFAFCRYVFVIFAIKKGVLCERAGLVQKGEKCERAGLVQKGEKCERAGLVRKGE
jgi:hypothetical protein